MALVEEFGDRIELFHVKDAIITSPTQFQQTTIGQGDVKLYVIEMDPPSNTWDPFAFAADSFQYVDCLTF